jgi:RNA polymerase sigma-70 factor (ECF subfamily)
VPGRVQPISVAGRRRARVLDARAPFEEVLTSAQAGFSSAFEVLFAQLAKPLAAFFRAQGAADPAGSTNDVLLRVFRGIDRFEGDEDGFRAWVFTIARNSLVDERRRARRRVQTTSMEPTDDLLPESPASEQGALARLGDADAVRAIESLVPDQREVLLLRIVADLTVDQVAQVVGKRPGAVKALQRRGLAALRRRLGREGVPP